jgi:tyrosinase
VRPGQNILKRRSTESTVTIPYERTFRNLDARPTGAGEEAFNFCGCGWPQHMLIPKGTAEGLRMELFVMISNYEEDRVDQSLQGTCNDAASYCGVRDRLYPDRKAMGYPFDRLNRAGSDTMAQFLTPNMRTQDVSIVFNDRTVERPRRQ